MAARPVTVIQEEMLEVLKEIRDRLDKLGEHKDSLLNLLEEDPMERLRQEVIRNAENLPPVPGFNGNPMAQEVGMMEGDGPHQLDRSDPGFKPEGVRKAEEWSKKYGHRG